MIGNIKEAVLPFVLEKAKLFKMGYKMTAGMSPTTLEKTMEEIRSRRSESESSSNPTATPSPEKDDGEVLQRRKTEESIENYIIEDPRKENVENPEGGVMEVTHSGPTLTQAEVEAGMKEVRAAANICTKI